MKTRSKAKTRSYQPKNTQTDKKKTALEKARSALKKSEHANSPAKIKQKIMGPKKKENKR